MTATSIFWTVTWAVENSGVGNNRNNGNNENSALFSLFPLLLWFLELRSKGTPCVSGYGLFAEGAAFTFFGDLGEEVVALVVYEDKCGEVFDLDFPDGFHAEFGVFEELDFLDGVLREHCGGAADAAQIESAVLMTCIGDLLGAVSFGNHDHRAAGGLELVDVAVHASGGGGAEAARGHTLRRLGRAGVVYGMVFEVWVRRGRGVP